MELEAMKTEITERFETTKAQVQELGKHRSELDRKIQAGVDEMKAIQGEYRAIEKLLAQKPAKPVKSVK